MKEYKMVNMVKKTNKFHWLLTTYFWVHSKTYLVPKSHLLFSVPQYVFHASSAVSDFLCFPQCCWTTARQASCSCWLSWIHSIKHGTTWSDIKLQQLAQLFVNTGACLCTGQWQIKCPGLLCEVLDQHPLRDSFECKSFKHSLLEISA